MAMSFNKELSPKWQVDINPHLNGVHHRVSHLNSQPYIYIYYIYIYTYIYIYIYTYTLMSVKSIIAGGPEKRCRYSILYPATTGRNFAEILRVIDSLIVSNISEASNWFLSGSPLVRGKLHFVPGIR